MILVRPGNKSRLAESIYKTFPKHHVYLEPFFGAGGLYFNKPQAMHNIVNDIDDDVFNLWSVYTKQYDKLLEAVKAATNTGIKVTKRFYLNSDIKDIYIKWHEFKHRKLVLMSDFVM